MSSTSRKPLKRLSLLQSPTSFSSPTFSSTDSPTVASRRVDRDAAGNTVQNAGSPNSSVEEPTATAQSEQVSKNARRQSSIYYVSRDRDLERIATDERLPVNERRFSAPQCRNNADDAASPISERQRKRQSVSVLEEQPAPMTLAEKHADLLRFIAQKESRCLELRSQLAVEEAELFSLKRKWERIVTRGHRGAPSASVSSLEMDPSAQGAVLAGLKEGVQGVGRLIAQLGELGTQGSDTGHVSSASISTSRTSSSSTRLSQSSVSSLGTFEDKEPEILENTTSDSADPHLKRHSLSTPVRRRPYELSSPSTPSPPILTPRTPLSASVQFSVAQTQPPTVKLSHSQTTVQVTSKHKKRMSVASGTFPPASSIPGVSVAPLVSWVDSVGKRLVQLHVSGHESEPRSNSNSRKDMESIHKRASTLLSDASSSLFAALTSPTRQSPVIDLTDPASPFLLDDDSDMHGNDLGTQWATVNTLSPERPKIAPIPAVPNAAVKKVSDNGTLPDSANGTDADGEEWNW
ncbi:uncharacterized protein FOMMEDRAFT_165954 [Fomitiporia mediterranea MF3/22]|uniref:uncharacterized protein n=1 Tax=Fomitiporia mediterranea (strain MF3/22) TaxID=694068 RepID=UPI000440959B|nr:uncharacterized protein FOMMEDRAFT_165954 [Fomitiporia mediterranea MF3/22]EJD05567.1 hypothetical protein FOMMEDRAFT_165954 [Fomitiporia mediterranea MF3/22]